MTGWPGRRAARSLSVFAFGVILLGGACIFNPGFGPDERPGPRQGKGAAPKSVERIDCPAPPQPAMPVDRLIEPPAPGRGKLPGAGGSGPAPGWQNLALALGLCGGLADMEYLLDLLGPGVGREEVALATRLLGSNRDLESFPEALVERILGHPDQAQLGPAVLLLDLGLKILSSPAYKKGGGAPAARHAVELLLDVYEGLYAALGEDLGALRETIEESGCIDGGDLEGLLSLAERVPAVQGLVLVAAAELTESEPGWAENSLQEGGEAFGAVRSPGIARLVEAAALEQLEPRKALDYIARKDLRVPVCNLERLRMLKEITGRGGQEEIFQWILDGKDGRTARLLVSSLNHKKHSGLLERIAFSDLPGGRLRAGAVVKLAGYRADEEIAQAVLSILEGQVPGRIDLFVQAAENLLNRSRPRDPWFNRTADALGNLLALYGGRLAGSVQADLVRVLELYRSAAGAAGTGEKD